MRYEVTEIDGFIRPSAGGSARPGMSCHVIDTIWNRRIVATFRTEDYASNTPNDARRSIVRERASARAAELNGSG